jgi:site-specific recombinase XerD
MARNLKYQFKYAIDQSCRFGADKHSMKNNKVENRNMKARTLSYADRKNLIDVSSNFSNWMKENHSDIKELKDVTSNHVQEFLNLKAKTCTSATIEQYQSKFSKLETLVNSTYRNADVSYTNTVTPSCSNNTGQLRSKTMTDSDYNKLNNYMSENCRSQNATKALQLSYHAGLRVSECAKLQQRDIRVNTNGTVTVHVADSKGCRSRDIEVINKDSVQALIEIRESVENLYDRIVPIQAESINKSIGRAMDKCNMQEYKNSKTSIHSVRKAYAQREYDRYKEQGLEPKEAWGNVSEALGHGRDRDDLYKTYIENK